MDNTSLKRESVTNCADISRRRLTDVHLIGEFGNILPTLTFREHSVHMRTVSYGGESFITSDEAAAALLDYAAAAALNNFAGVVHVPVLNAEGAVVTADLVIGPSSELFVTPSDSTFDDPDTDLTVADLKARTSELTAARRVSMGSPIEQPEDDSNYFELP